MTLERSKKPSQVVLETGKPKRVEPTQTPETKTPHAPMAPSQIQRARARFDRDTAALQRKVSPTESTPRDLTPVGQVSEQKVLPAIQAKPNALHSGFVKSTVQRRALETIKNQSIQASSLRADYQAAITPDIVQRLADQRTTQQSQEARASQAPNALNTRTDWFNTELPVLRARHNNPDQPELDNASVFGQSDARARDLGKTYVAQRLSSGLTANDAATAIVNIQRSRDRNNALKGMLSAIRPQDSDYSRIQRLVSEKEQNLELQRRALEEGAIPQALQLAKEQANPTQANSGISEKIKAKIGGGSPLPEHVRSQLETGLNTNLEAVRVHTDAEADVLAKSVNAIAFTTGKDIFFSSGSYDPNTKTGYTLIAHEVTHTVQQANGLVEPGVDKNSGLEHDAQAKGAELAAKFDEHAKPVATKASPNPSSSSAQSSLGIQRDAAPVLQRVIDSGKVEQAAAALFKAMDGFGTDEAAIMRALSGKTPFELKAIQDAYKARYNRNLKADLQDELSGDDLSKALALLNAVGSNAVNTGATPKPDVVVQNADRLRAAMAGVGTDEAAIHSVFAGKTAPQIKAIRDAYEKKFHRDLEADLRDELSGADLQRALKSLAVVGTRVEAKPQAGESYQVNPDVLAADQLHDAMAGAGTDEAKILRVLKGKTPAQIQAIQAVYQKKYKTNLLLALRDELSGAELNQALLLLGVGDEKKDHPKNIKDAADKLFKAMDGHGTDETAIYDVLEGKTPAQIQQIIIAYRDIYRRELETDLRSELNADELAVVLPALTGKGLPANRAKSALARIYDSIHWYSDDEDQIEETLAKLSPAELQELRTLTKNDPKAKAVLERVLSNLGGTDLAVTKALIGGDKAAASAARIAQAIEGLGTNETRVYKYLQEKVDQYLETDIKPSLEQQFANNPAKLTSELEKARQAFLTQIRAAYKTKTGRTLEADISDDFSGTQKDQADALVKGDKAAASAARIQDAAEGFGTNEAAITAELKGKSQEERTEIMIKFAQKYGEQYKPQFIEQYVADFRIKHQKAHVDKYINDHLTAAQKSAPRSTDAQIRQQLHFEALRDFNRLAQTSAARAFDPSNPSNMRQVMQTMFNDELSGNDLLIADQNLTSGKTDDDLALQIAIEGIGTDEAAIREILKDKTSAEIKAIAAAYQKRTGRPLKTDLADDLDGRDAFDANQSLEGTPVTPEDHLRRANASEAFERSENSSFSSFMMASSEMFGFNSKGTQLDYSTSRLREMFDQIKDSKGNITYKLKPGLTKEDVARVAEYQKTDTQNYIEAKNTVTEALATGAEIAVAALVTVLTEGAATPWLVAALSGVAGTATGVAIKYGMDSNAYGNSSIAIDVIKGTLETALGVGLAKGLPIGNAIEEMAVKFGDQFTKETLRKLAQSVAQKSTTAAIKGAGGKTIENILNDDNWRKGAAEYLQAIGTGAASAAIKGGLSAAATTVLKDFASKGLSKADIESALVGTVAEKVIENGVSEAANYINNLLNDTENQRFEDILRNILRKALKGLAEDKFESFVMTTRFKILANVAIQNADNASVATIIAQQIQELNLHNGKYEDVLKNLDQQQMSALMMLVSEAKQKTSSEALDDIRDRIKTNNPQAVLPSPDLQNPPPAQQQPIAVQRDQQQASQLVQEQTNPNQANSGIGEKIKAKIGGGSPLPENVRTQLETNLNTNLEAVRVHTDGEADKLAKSVNAVAFTSGQDIFFSSGSYEPNTKTGYELIAHEVTHTLQQASGLVEPGVDKAPGLEDQAKAKGAELAAKFDEHAKPAQAKPSSKPSSSSVPTNLAVQRDAAGPLNQLLTTPATETIGKYDGTVSAVNSALESKKAKEQQGLPELPTPTGIPAKGSVQGKTSAPGGKIVKASDPRIPSGNTPVANVRVPQIAGKPAQARTYIAAGKPSTTPTTDGKPPQADPAVAAKANNELENVSTSADNMTTSMGEPPKVQLTGDLDPAIMEENRKQHDTEIKTQEDQAAKDREHNFGENDIAPKARTGKVKSQKKLAIKKISAKGGSSVKVKAELKAKLDASLSSPLQTKLRPEADKATTGEKTQDQAMVKERSKADKDIQKLEADTAKDQGLQKTQSQNMVKEQRKTWKLETEKIQTKFSADAKSKYTTQRADIKLEETKGNSEANRIVKDANRDAKSKKDEAQQKSESEKNNAKSESKGFFGWLADKAASLVNKLKDTINAIYDTLRSVVKTIFEAAKTLVTAAIDLAATAIKGLITAFGEALKLLASVALAAFPELKKKFCDFIDKSVETANAYVDKAADILKTAVTAVLDFLASTIDKLLSLIQDLYNAALTVIGMILKGEFKELLEKLGHLVTAIKGVTWGGVETAIMEQFLGEGLDQPLDPNIIAAARAQGWKGGKAPAADAANLEGALPTNLEGNVSVDKVAQMQLSPELQKQLLEKGDGETDLGTSSDPSRSVEGIQKEIEKQQGGAKESEQPGFADDGLSARERAGVRWTMMKKAASDWWSNNWGYVVAGGVVAIGGVIALNIFTGGAITAALPVIMQILTAVFLAQTIAQVGGYVSSFVSQSWAGNTAGGTKALNNGLAVGVVELASYLTMKAGSVLAKGGKLAVNAAKSTVKAGVNLAKRGAQVVIKGAKWILEKGKLIFKGLDNAAGRAAKTLRGLGDDILQRVGFKGVKIKVHGRRFEIWGQINPWVLLASGDLKFVDDVAGEVGDKVKVGRQEGIVVGRNGKPGSGANPSEFVDDLANQTKKARKATFEELDGLDLDKLKGKIQGGGSKSTYELRKGIDEADQLPHFEAHHLAPEELLKDPKIKQFFDDIQFNPQDGARNGVMLPKQKFANADEYRKFLEDLKYDPGKIDDAVVKFDPNKWNNATPHNGSHPNYTQKMLDKAQELRQKIDDLVEQLELNGLPKEEAVKQARNQVKKDWDTFLQQTRGNLLDGSIPLN